ncbi:unnamed protein product [Rangifer tarandus platyrhynchus]|uniref:Uncharacterized protein n=2 Tax=Rangifer tarandus platyrhynchus TaxID=3082113 RepID=A0ACB0E5W3_RANTA|nr:unnamed protein product [Rangifer tarandus platyrhynchus]CAI9695985.1 unnamed protein product [Rangifer tarandus platyrhynchus]
MVVVPEARLLRSLSPGAYQACSPKALPPSLSELLCLPSRLTWTPRGLEPDGSLTRTRRSSWASPDLASPDSERRQHPPGHRLWPVVETWLCRACVQALLLRDPGILRGPRQPHIPGSPQESAEATAHWPSCFRADPTGRLTPVAI